MVRIRESKEERNANQLKKIEKNFTNQVDKFNLKDLSLEELATRYEDIDRQSQLFKGLILLEARSRFKSNNEFGDWVKSVQTLCLDAQEVRTRYMNLARYFKDKEMTGISITAAYEISAPINEAIADKVYEYAKGKNLKVAEVKQKIAELKNKAGIPFSSRLVITLSNCLIFSLSEGSCVAFAVFCNAKNNNPPTAAVLSFFIKCPHSFSICC